METYVVRTGKRTKKVPFDVLSEGNVDCKHELMPVGFTSERLTVSDGIVFADFECKLCGRKLSQEIGEIQYPDWKK